MYFYVLKDKNVYKMPKDVIREKLSHFPIQLSSKATCQINCHKLDTALLRKAWKNASIDFSKSKVKEKPCPIYYLTLNENIGALKTLECSLCDEFVVLQQFVEDKPSCECK
jgi:hypothetical protein